MKPLVVFYSRTGTTKKVASVISDNLNGTLEEIVDTVDRSGISGYAAAREDALLKRNTVIKEIHNDPALFDLIVIGTPVWLHTVSNPIRTYISQNKDKFKTVAFFCTQPLRGVKALFRRCQASAKSSQLVHCSLPRMKSRVGNLSRRLDNLLMNYSQGLQPWNTKNSFLTIEVCRSAPNTSCRSFRKSCDSS